MSKPQTARSQELATRIGGLDSDKRQQLFRKLGEAGVNVARLPIVPAIEQGPLPLSYAQQRQWFLWQLDPQGTAYNLCQALRLRGALDQARLRGAFEQLQARHASLRTRFVEVDGQPLQEVGSQGELDWQVLPAQPAIAIEQLIETRLRYEAETPFDLARAAPMRVRVQPLGSDDCLLQVSLHHIVTDGWSMGVMIEELLECYRAACSGEAAQLPTLAIQYADYAMWQRQWLQAGERERQLAYWRQCLGSSHDVLALPLDHPRPARPSGRGASLAVQLPASLAGALKHLAQQQDVSLFTVLLGSFQLLLRRYSGQQHVRIGVPLANRNRAETERLIGFFVNTLVISDSADQQRSFGQHLQDLRETVQQAQAHQDLPFEQLVEALQPQRNASHSPLFQVMFNHQVQPAVTQGLAIAGLSVALLEQQQRSAQFDLTLDTTENAHGLHACFTYASDVLEPATVERLARHWQNLLEALVAEPQRPMLALQLLDDVEREQLVEGFNATATQYPLDTPVHRLIEAQMDRTPNAEAVRFGEHGMTYAQLDARANQLAHKLQEQGVGPDVLVGIAAERSLEMVVGLLAILKAGGAYVPLDPEYPAERLRYMFEDSGIALLLSQSHLQLPLPQGLSVLQLDTLALDAYPSVRPLQAVNPENLAYVIYTSGSTGKPKGAGNRHSALTNRLCWMQQAYGLDSSDTVLQKTPFSFDVSVWEFFWPLMFGARLVMAAPGDHRDPARLVALINQ
ncbi:TPA: AMP-binding protein, partial [Pseudomonas putida]|nr:AMP-binding protein [Pseudomonas putida]